MARLYPNAAGTYQRPVTVRPFAPKPPTPEQVALAKKLRIAEAKERKVRNAFLRRKIRRGAFLRDPWNKIRLFVYGLFGVSNRDIITEIMRSKGRGYSQG